MQVLPLAQAQVLWLSINVFVSFFFIILTCFYAFVLHIDFFIAAPGAINAVSLESATITYYKFSSWTILMISRDDLKLSRLVMLRNCDVTVCNDLPNFCATSDAT